MEAQKLSTIYLPVQEQREKHIGLELIDVNADELFLDHNLYASNAARPLQVTSFVFDGITYNSSSLTDWQSVQEDIRSEL